MASEAHRASWESLRNLALSCTLLRVADAEPHSPLKRSGHRKELCGGAPKEKAAVCGLVALGLGVYSSTIGMKAVRVRQIHKALSDVFKSPGFIVSVFT